MSDAVLNWFTNHFGHNKNVCFAWYRREDSTIKLTKVTRASLAVDEDENVQNKKIDNVFDSREVSTISQQRKSNVGSAYDSIEDGEIAIHCFLFTDFRIFSYENFVVSLSHYWCSLCMILYEKYYLHDLWVALKCSWRIFLTYWWKFRNAAAKVE